MNAFSLFYCSTAEFCLQRQLFGSKRRRRGVMASFHYQVSISPTFFSWLFCMNFLRKAFLYLNFRFELFWFKNIGANALIKCCRNWPLSGNLISQGNFKFHYALHVSIFCCNWCCCSNGSGQLGLIKEEEDESFVSQTENVFILFKKLVQAKTYWEAQCWGHTYSPRFNRILHRR